MYPCVFRNRDKDLCIAAPTSCFMMSNCSTRKMNFKIRKVNMVDLNAGKDYMHDLRIDVVIKPVGDSTVNTWAKGNVDLKNIEGTIKALVGLEISQSSDDRSTSFGDL